MTFTNHCSLKRPHASHTIYVNHSEVVADPAIEPVYISCSGDEAKPKHGVRLVPSKDGWFVLGMIVGAIFALIVAVGTDKLLAVL